MRETIYHLATTLNAILDGVIVTDRDNTIVRLNPAAEQLTGWNMSECQGKRLDEVLDLRDAKTGDVINVRVTDSLDAATPIHFDTQTLLRDRTGITRPINGTVAPIRQTDGLVWGLVLVFRDCTAERDAQHEIEHRERLLQNILDTLPICVMLKDAQGRYIFVNEDFCRRLQKPRKDLLGKTVYDIFNHDFATTRSEQDEAVLTTGVHTIHEGYGPSDYLPGYWVTGATKLELSPKTGPLLLRYALDITDRHKTEAELQETNKQLLASEERFRNVVDAAGEYVWETDHKWRITFISNQVERIFGYTPAELMGRHILEFLPDDELPRFEHFIQYRKDPRAPFNSLELRLIHKSGKQVWQQVSGVPIVNEEGRIVGYRGACMDIHARKMAEQQVEQLATRDFLTGLPNRLLLNDRLEHAIISALRREKMIGLMVIDLDRFKKVNDSLGHDVGDLLLKAFADRLSTCIRRGDTLARLGGDEFTVLLYDLKTAEDAAIVARKMLLLVNQPYEIEGHTFSTGCSIGISIFPGDGPDGATLMRSGATAMHHAKDSGRNNYQFFSPEMNTRAVERLNIESELRVAVQKQQFTLCYQPQVDVQTNEIIGAEALVRWLHPETGQHISPGLFISVAEDTGLIVPIGEWVLRTACAQAKAWQDAWHPELRITVNVSVGQFRSDASLATTIEQILKETGLQAKHLELEMTESLLFHNIEENMQLLAKLAQMGVCVSIDDFGTGYSSLSYLKKLPVDTIKIDRSFVRDIVTDENDAAIIGAIIAMARRLKLRVIAEGVETLEQLNELRDLHCDEYQGYFFSKPVPAEEFAKRFFGRTTDGILVAWDG